MWSKLLITVMTAILLAVVCFPVQAHDGRLSNRIDPLDGDEQPWGGDSHYSGSDLPQLSAPDPGIFQGTNYFILLTFDYGWFTISEYVLDTFSSSKNDTKTFTTPAVPIDNRTIGNQNSDSGVGAE
jgi:hypothetical protein